MRDEATISRIVQAVRERRRRQSAYDSSIWTRHAIRPLVGGMNNAAYAFTINGVTRCLKLYKVDQRNRAQREWAALTFLADRGLRIVPQPL